MHKIISALILMASLAEAVIPPKGPIVMDSNEEGVPNKVLTSATDSADQDVMYEGLWKYVYDPVTDDFSRIFIVNPGTPNESWVVVSITFHEDGTYYRVDEVVFGPGEGNTDEDEGEWSPTG